MSSKVWSIGIQKHTKMIQHLVHIRSTDQFNQVRVHEKKMTEMRSIVWMTIAFGYAFALPSRRSEKVLDNLLTDFCSLNCFGVWLHFLKGSS